MYKVYILRSKSDYKTYVGITDNIERRLKEHNAGKSFYTCRYKPWKLIYSKEYKDIKSARTKEKYFKSCAGRKKMKNFLNHQ